MSWINESEGSGSNGISITIGIIFSISLRIPSKERDTESIEIIMALVADLILQRMLWPLLNVRDCQTLYLDLVAKLVNVQAVYFSHLSYALIMINKEIALRHQPGTRCMYGSSILRYGYHVTWRRSFASRRISR